MAPVPAFRAGYVAARGFEAQLEAELAPGWQRFDRLYLSERPLQTSYWAENVWEDIQLIPIRSIGEGVKALRAIQRDWALCSIASHRRAALIAAQLPRLPAGPFTFGQYPLPKSLGSWTLWDDAHILAAPRCQRPFPNGEPIFAEDKINPPSRAYLKLWEGLTLESQPPVAGQRCLELGAAPGGWTWVLVGMGAQVVAVDRAPLDPRLMANDKVHWRKGDAFAVKPEDVGAIDWLFSDVICYPEKLYAYVQSWIASGLCRRFFCTLKFQGDEHYGIIKEFAAIPGSRILHLFHNKHELTWICHVPEP